MEKRTPSRPTTPLRPSSRTSLRESQTFTPGGGTSSAFPLDSLEPAFAELSDSMADLEANFMHLQLMHESLSRFNENFASFLYGLNMNAFCVDFPEDHGHFVLRQTCVSQEAVKVCNACFFRVKAKLGAQQARGQYGERHERSSWE
ncbi:MAG: hypothetical protein Q9208_001771 [Pyrenodesmia sp. 3 TL-2023]